MGNGQDMDVDANHEEDDAVREAGDLRRAHVRRTKERERPRCGHDPREHDLDGCEETMASTLELAFVAAEVRFELS